MKYIPTNQSDVFLSPGLHSDYRPEEDPRGSSALHHPQHHRAGQTQPGVTRTRPGRPAGQDGEPGPAAEHPQPEGGAGHQKPEGRREAGEEEEEETEQPQPSQLPQEEEERSTHATAEEAVGGAGGEGEEKSTQEKKDGLSSCRYKHMMKQQNRDSGMFCFFL